MVQQDRRTSCTSGAKTKPVIIFTGTNSKVYVQNLMVRPDNAKELQNAIQDGAYVYVCGATKMGQDVLDAFTKVVEEQQKVSNKDAQVVVKGMQDSGRYVQELW